MKIYGLKILCEFCNGEGEIGEARLFENYPDAKGTDFEHSTWFISELLEDQIYQSRKRLPETDPRRTCCDKCWDRLDEILESEERARRDDVTALSLRQNLGV